MAYIGPGSENEFVMPAPMTHFVILIVNIYYIYNDNQRDETKRQRTRTQSAKTMSIIMMGS